jgi:hypothetical protein
MAEADVAGTHGLACKDLGDELRRGFAHGIGIDNPHDVLGLLRSTIL